MSKSKVFLMVMLIISALAMITSAIKGDYITSLCDFILCIMWGWDYYSLTQEDR